MASTQQIKRRIRSVKSTKQITKAMELVAASKMRKAQEATLRSRAYRNTAREILTRINELTDVSAHPLYDKRKVKSRLYIVVTSDRGLAGAYNANLLREFTKTIQADRSDGVGVRVIMIGKQGARFAAKIEDLDVVGVYENFAENPSANDLKPILDTAINLFAPSVGDIRLLQAEAKDEIREHIEEQSTSRIDARAVDEVVMLYTDFKSSISQVATAQTLLPAAFEPADSPGDLREAPFEPSPKVVLETITPKLIEVQLFQAILESQASEHSMRMLAMKSASDNASDLIDDLTLAFNSARQAAITQELAEITSGAEAIS